jgi:uroporphyrinogen-III synthase
MKILVTRPIKLAQELEHKISALNHEAIICPLLEISILDKISTEIPSIISSQHALSCIGNKNTKLYVLGERTSEIAQSLGYTDIIYAGDNINELKKNIPQNEKLLYLSGKEVTDDLSQFSNITRKIVYQASPITSIPIALTNFIKTRETKSILFFSSKSAKTFINLTKNYRLYNNFNDIIALSLSKKISSYLKNYGFKNIYTAKEPKLVDLIKLIGML